MKILENINLAEYTTFKIGGPARFFCIAESVDDVKQAVTFAKEKEIPFFVLGGGSNLLVSDTGFPGLVIKVEIKGIEVRGEIISVGAGEPWDDFVEYSVKNGWSGLENLSAIPGTVGAAPVQNIGAYGTEVGYFISSVHAFDTKEMKEVEMLPRDCHFGYRNSTFKHEKGRYVITFVDFKLKKDGKVNIEYRDLKEYFENNNQDTITNNQRIAPSQVREAVLDIRRNKLPDWNKWGTAGSFFKNPVVSKEKFSELKEKYSALPGFPEVDANGHQLDQVKIPLGWILDNVCKAKGVTSGGVGTYKNQALVIVTKPGATAKEVVDFTQGLMKQVKEATGITVEAEVEWVN